MAENLFHHEEIYRGADAIKALGERSIVICGAGALGSNLVENMARQGFRQMRVIDRDRVETHNINTQVWVKQDVGALKVDALKTRVFRSVGVEIDAVSKELTASNAATLVKQASLVVDTFDNTVSRQMVQDACRAKKLQCLHVGLYQDYGEVVWDDIYRVPNDQGEGDVCDYPLARNIAMLAVIVATEEIMDFCLAKTPRRKSWSITLRDLKIRER